MGIVSLVCFLTMLALPLTEANRLYFDWAEAQDADLPPTFVQGTGRGPKALDTWDCEHVVSLPDEVRNEFPLDPFYTKYTHAFGIPIISSDAPSDEALTRSCYVVRFMLADRSDLRNAMYDGYGRVGVIGWTENTTDIPEHSYLSDAWNVRARGLGGTHTNPISTSAEENLRCDEINDRWFQQDVLVHEFAHAIHLIALHSAEPDFNVWLKEIHGLAKDEGLWPNTYAITSHIEYFAVGTQVFFEVAASWSLGGIDTRAALKIYDLRLYNLLEWVFPCQNVILPRCPAADQDYAFRRLIRSDCTC